MKIYTKTGDDGTTGLFGAARVRKDDARVSAYGDVDELNSALGLARCECDGEPQIALLLAELQSELFTLGAQLATPDAGSAPKNVPAIGAQDVQRLERAIDSLDSELPPLRAFVLPAGTRLAAALHLGRTICRRAERSVVSLAAREPLPAHGVEYLNRLSDLLFTLARVANHRAGAEESKWEPNKH